METGATETTDAQGEADPVSDPRFTSLVRSIARADRAALDAYARGVSFLDAAVAARLRILNAAPVDDLLDVVDVTASPLSHLDPLDLVVCERVSKSWQSRTLEASLKRELYFDEDAYDSSDGVWSKNITNETFEKLLILRRYVSLETLYISDTSCQISSLPRCLGAVGTNCPSLKELGLFGFGADNWKSTDAAFIAVSEGCPLLATLRLSSDIASIGPGFPSLTTLCMPNYYEAMRLDLLNSLENLMPGCPVLEHVDFSECFWISPSVIHSVGINCKRLKRLDLTWCREVTDASLNAVADGCPLLEHLDICQSTGYFDDGEFQSKITDASMTKILSKCTALRWLNISCCIQLAEASFDYLATHPSLTHLYAKDLPSLADRHATRLLAECPSLQRLEVGGSGGMVCPLISSQLNAIARSYSFAATHDGRELPPMICFIGTHNNHWTFTR